MMNNVPMVMGFKLYFGLQESGGTSPGMKNEVHIAGSNPKS
jgi:hypothetical protein